MTTLHPLPAGGQALALSSASTDTSPPLGEEVPVGSPHQIAIRSDGAVLLSVEELGDRDLKGRTVWTAVVLTLDEATYVHQRGVNAAHEAAANLAGQLPKKKEGESS